MATPAAAAVGIPAAGEAVSAASAAAGAEAAVHVEYPSVAIDGNLAGWRKPLDVGSPGVVSFVEACHLPAIEFGRQIHQLISQQGMHFGWILAQS